MSDAGQYLDPEEMTLGDYLGVLRRRKWLVAIPVIVVTVVALALTFSQTKLYRASTEVLVKEPPSATAIGAPERPMQQRVLQNELQRAQGSEMRRQVREVVGAEPLIGVKLAASEDVDVFVFVGESSDPQAAADAANAYAQVYISERRASLTVDLEAQATVVVGELERLDGELPEVSDVEERTSLEIQRDSYQFQLDQLTTSINLAQRSGASVIDAAQVPSAPFDPKPVRIGAIAIAFGLMLGLAAALATDFFDNSLRGEDDLAATSKLTVLGVIPRLKNWKKGEPFVVTRDDPTSATAEAYRAFRTAVHFSTFARGLKVIQITSPKPGDGKTTTSTNLAVASARAGQSVLLIDCDLRRPRVHRFFDLPNEVGFTTVMVGGTLEEVVQKIDGEPNLSVISSGPIMPDPSELLSSPIAQRFVESTRTRFDLVIIDSPPVLVVADPLVISSSADGVVLVTSALQSDRRDVARAVEQLEQLDAYMMGALLNSFDVTSSTDYRHSYGVYEQPKT